MSDSFVTVEQAIRHDAVQLALNYHTPSTHVARAGLEEVLTTAKRISDFIEKGDEEEESDEEPATDSVGLSGHLRMGELFN